MSSSRRQLNQNPINLKPKSSLVDFKRKLKDRLEKLDAQTELALLKLTLSKFKVTNGDNGAVDPRANGLADQPPAQTLILEPDYILQSTAKDYLQEIFLQEYVNTEELDERQNEEEVDIAKRVEIIESAMQKTLFA